MAFFKFKKNKLWIWKAYCRDTGQLIDWECGRRDEATLTRLMKRLEKWQVKIFCADHWEVYPKVIEFEKLTQSKSETHAIERNNSRQRHWLARFKRKSLVISKSLAMVDLSIFLFARFRVNGNIEEILELFSYYSLNEMGKCSTAEGQNLLERLGDKFASDFNAIPKNDTVSMRALLSRASWFYAAAPEPFKNYVRSALTAPDWDALPNSLKNTIIESACRMLTDGDDILKIFSRIIREINARRFPTDYARALARLLRFRHDAASALTKKYASNLAGAATSLLVREAEAQNFAQTFFQGVILLLYLLRFRETMLAFAMPNQIGRQNYEQAKKLLKTAEDHFKNSGKSTQLTKAIQASCDFEAFLDKKALALYPQAVLDLSGES